MPKPLRWYRDLADTRTRRAEGLFVVEGPRAVRQVLGSSPEAVAELLVAGDTEFGCGASVAARTVTRRQFDSVCSTVTPQGVLAVVALPEGVYGAKLPDCTQGDVLVCEDIQDPGNVGTLIRTAAAFGFEGAVLSDRCADPFGPKAVQATAGSVLSVWVRRTAQYLDLVESLRLRGHLLVAADAHGGGGDGPPESDTPVALALGSEGSGLSERLRALADRVLTVPVDSARAESLNVAAAGAVCMYLAASRRHRAGEA